MLLTEYDPAKVLEIARKNSYAEGRAEGREEGQTRLFKLLLRMNEAGEAVDIQTLSVNEEELERLYRKYGI